jgi:GNAT superfamily N-acetyltransferase
MEIVSFTKNNQKKTEAFIRSIYLEMDWPEDPKDGLTNLTEYFHIPHEGFLFLVKQDDGVIATGGCIKLNATDCLLKRFYIHKDYRGMGLAKQLLDKIHQAATPLHVSRIVIDVSKKNLRSIRFFEKNGYVEYKPPATEAWKESLKPEFYNYYSFTL